MNLCPLKWFNIRLIAFWSFTNRGKFWVNDEFPVQFSSVAHLHSYREIHKHTHTYIFWFGSSFDSRPNNDSNLLLLLMIFIPLARGANALYNKVHCSAGSKIAKVQHGSSSSKKRVWCQNGFWYDNVQNELDRCCICVQVTIEFDFCRNTVGWKICLPREREMRQQPQKQHKHTNCTMRQSYNAKT